MEIVGSIDPKEVPSLGIRASGVWTNLAVQVMQAHQAGKVLVIKTTDRAEYKKMSNGMSEKIRQGGYSRQFTAEDNEDGSVTVYCQLVGPQPQSVVVSPIRKPRKRASG